MENRKWSLVMTTSRRAEEFGDDFYPSSRTGTFSARLGETKNKKAKRCNRTNLRIVETPNSIK
jgi:hypothetical protein